MIMNNKRGISNIVASVLIILLAIIGVSLIGYLIYKLINGTTGTAECNQQLNDANFEIYEPSVVINGLNVSFRVERKDSEEDIKAFPIIQILGPGDNSYTTNRYNNTEFPLSSRPLIDIPQSEHNLNNITKIRIYKAVICENGNINSAEEPTDEFTPAPPENAFCGDSVVD